MVVAIAEAKRSSTGHAQCRGPVGHFFKLNVLPPAHSVGAQVE